MNDLNLNEIVKIEQMPKVFEQLEIIGDYIDKNLEGIDNLNCTEENKNLVKNRRTEISNTLTLLEDRRKEIKSKINEPYEIFNKKYESTIKKKLEDAKKTLTFKIDFIEIEQKNQKSNKIRDYFEEYKTFKNIDFINFEQVGLNVTLSVSEKSLKEQTKKFLDKIESDLNLIASQEHKEEILIEYKKSLNVSDAITKVIDRYKELEEIKLKQAEIEAFNNEKDKHIKEVEKALKMPQKEEIKDKKIFELNFKVRGTKNKLIELKNFLKIGGYDYE